MIFHGVIILNICFVDTLGLCYDGTTLSKRGLGGSESAIILMSRELVKLGLNVTVFNDCASDDARPGIYDGVRYEPLKNIENYPSFDVFIASRSVASLAPDDMKNQFKWSQDFPNFERVAMASRHRVLWMHDTFCDGDDLIEDFVLQGRINEIFTLTDWHTTYVTNCDHGKRRNFDILKKHIFQTRNGINLYHDWVDISKKDPNLFVYNASVTKGMIPLVNSVWPIVKESLPDAKLKVVGGFYRFRSSHGPDQQEMDWREMVANPVHAERDIDFTGIISQKEIADILAQSSFMIYPSAFPETFGISTLESLAYNTPLISCTFGALEETALDMACYKIPYPVEKNWSLPWLNEEYQIKVFADTTIRAYHDKYLHQQKMYACNQVRDICEWSTVALQWKQHLYRNLGEFLPVEEYRRVTDINNRVHKVFGRRFNNYAENTIRKREERKIVVVSPVYNAENYIEKCIRSVVSQDYKNYVMYIINDCSTDNTLEVINKTIEELGTSKVKVIDNEKNYGAVYNQIRTIKTRCMADDIVMLLDGDDWLLNDPNIFNMYNNLYHDGAEYTYGSCWSLTDNIPLIAQPYPPEIKKTKSYRQHKFNWNFPYPHLRTFIADLVFKVREEVFRDDKGEWYRAGGDVSTFFNIIEQADPDKVICVPDIVYMYNDINPLNDYKVNGIEQNETADSILDKKNDSVIRRLKQLHDMNLLPNKHKTFLSKLSKTNKPKVIYDIGASVLHWTNVAKNIWPDSEFILFEAMDECAPIFEEAGIKYHCGVLGAEDGKEVDFYQNLENPAGNSYYRENVNVNPVAHEYFPDESAVKKIVSRLDTIVEQKKFPKPDLIKIDVQGAELDVLRGAKNTLENCEHLIVELQFVHYNEGAPLYTEVVEFLESLGFTNHGPFSGGMVTENNNVDGDFYFSKKKETKEGDINQQQITSKPLFEKFSVVIPTMWRTECLTKLLNRIIPHPLVDQILLIDNDTENRFDLDIDSNKLEILVQDENIGVNPAWNLGVSLSRNNKILIVNDDVEFDVRLFDKAYDFVTPENGTIGLCPGVSEFNQPPITDRSIDIIPWDRQHTFGFGCLFFVHKETWKPIPQGLKIYYGDNFIFDRMLHLNKTNYIITNMDFSTVWATTTSDLKLTEGVLDKERKIYEKVKLDQFTEKRVKKILIAIPTARYIEPETMRSIYNLEIPEGYTTQFEFFYGYQIDQVRNLIAHWIVNYDFDYLFSVDSDIIFERDTLKKLLSHDVPLVSGMYRQRLPEQVIELYDLNQVNLPYDVIQSFDQDFFEIGGCGFGCVLVKKEVFQAIGYPYFEYHSAISHEDTFSEDVDFCQKTQKKGFKMYADRTIKCGHKGTHTFQIT